MIDLDKWWQSLKVTEKERIASKVAKENVSYPECTQVWALLSEDRKILIHDHCTDEHGIVLPEWSEGKSMSY